MLAIVNIFSSNDGNAYGNYNDPENTGTYQVKGNVVMLTFPNGSTDQAKVNMQQNDGRITELMYNGKLFATGLCE